MMDSALPAFIVFGVLFGLCMIGLFSSRATSARLTGACQLDIAGDLSVPRGTCTQNLTDKPLLTVPGRIEPVN